MNSKRCAWASKEIFHRYHDTEWCVPVHCDITHFEFLTLEGAQAGLSWETILKKREGYKKAFDDFDPKKISKYSQSKIDKLLNNPKIVRNKLKVESTVSNSIAFLKIQKEYGSFDKYIWGFVNNKQIVNSIKNTASIPSSTELSDKISKDLKNKGFRFVGTTIVYSYMQAIGMVNDHENSCDYKKS